MVSIYLIEDCNALQYVGSTHKKLQYRLTQHKYDKKRNRNTTSKLLDLNNSEIWLLEKCNDSNRKEKEQLWINKINCVNQNNSKGHKLYSYKNKKYDKKNYKLKSEYQVSWGGNIKYYYNNSLLKISLDIFK